MVKESKNNIRVRRVNCYLKCGTLSAEPTRMSIRPNSLSNCLLRDIIRRYWNDREAPK